MQMYATLSHSSMLTYEENKRLKANFSSAYSCYQAKPVKINTRSFLTLKNEHLKTFMELQI